MSILVNKDTKILVQGLTGIDRYLPHRTGRLPITARQMVGGIHPSKGGTNWTGSKGETLRSSLPLLKPRKRPALTHR